MAIDDNEDILFALKLLLKSHVEVIDTLNDPSKIPDYISTGKWDVILEDFKIDQNGLRSMYGGQYLLAGTSALILAQSK